MIYDAVVIGAGMAGSTAAFHLATLGYKTLLLEKEAEAHHKVCGEFLSPEAHHYLTEMGVNLQSAEYHSPEIKQFNLFSKNFNCHLDFKEYAQGFSRKKLDELLINKARGAGAELKRPCTVQHYEMIPEAKFNPRLNTHEQTNTTSSKHDSEALGSKPIFKIESSQGELFGRAIFLATGKHDFKSLHKREGSENSAIGLKMYFKLSKKMHAQQKENIDLFLFRGGYAGMSFIEDDIANCSFIIDKKIYKELGGKYENALSYLKKQNPQLNMILDGAKPQLDKALAISNIPYGYVYKANSKPLTSNSSSQGKELTESINSSKQNEAKAIYYLGDQFAVIPSFAGSGMSIALFTGKNAALHFHNSSVQEYNQSTYKALAPIINFGYQVHAMAQQPILMDLVTLGLKLMPAVNRFILKKTRIPQI